MNTGIQNAFDLGWRRAATLAGSGVLAALSRRMLFLFPTRRDAVSYMSKSGSLCALPFVHLNLLATGRATLCCKSNTPLKSDNGKELNVRTHTLRQIWESTALKDIRAKMLAGESVPHCRGCIEYEKKGFGSHRTENTERFLAKEGERPTAIQITHSELSTSMPKPYYFDLRFDNLCNLKCVICNGWASSRIE